MIRRVLVAVALLLGCTGAGAAERFALLIGNSRYEQAAPLRNPENDIAVVAESLRAVGFKTSLVSNASLAAMNEAIDRFVGEVKGIERPVLLVYYAGHGIQRNGRNFLLPVDARVDDAQSLEGSAIDADRLLKRLADIDAELRIVVLDACRDDPFEAASRGGAGLKKGLAEIPQASGELIAFSTAPGKTAADGNTGTSPYASAFAEALLVPGLTVRTVFDRVRALVRERTKGAQEPWETSALYHDFAFVPSTQDVEISEVEALLWENAALLDSAETYQKYIDRFPNGRFAALAQQKIVNINKDFAFRKQSETFPIVTAVTGELDFCSRKRPTESASDAFDLLNGIFAYEDELIYVNWNIPLKNILCRERPDGMRIEATAPKSGECYDVISTFSDAGLGSIDCRRSATSKGTDEWSKIMSQMGGLIIHQDAEGLFLPALNAEYYKYAFNEAEGQIDSASITVQGLVRVRITTTEDFAAYLLEPVDPNTLGVSWKFLNTLEAYREGAEDTRAKPLSLQALIEKNIADSEASLRKSIVSYWKLESSVLALLRDGDGISLIYVEPSETMAKQGIVKEMTMLEGRLDGGTISGTVYPPSDTCSLFPYDVTGTISQEKGEMVLSGTAKTLNEGCEETGTQDQHLLLEFAGTPETVTYDIWNGAGAAEEGK